MKRRLNVLFCSAICLICSTLSPLATTAHADILPPNSQYVQHTMTFHGSKAFPKHHFVLVGNFYNWDTPQVMTEGQKLPFLKFGGLIFAISKTTWKKLSADKKNLKTLNKQKLTKLGFPFTQKAVYISRFVRRPTRIKSRVSKFIITGIKGKRVEYKVDTQDFDASGKLIPSKASNKTKKTSMNLSPKAPGRLAALPTSVVFFGLLILFFGIRRQPQRIS